MVGPDNGLTSRKERNTINHSVITPIGSRSSIHSLEGNETRESSDIVNIESGKGGKMNKVKNCLVKCMSACLTFLKMISLG